jgi:hypothetical protein
MLSATISSVTDSELAFIAGRDYGVESEKHFSALRRVIFEQSGIPLSGQEWFPYEVVELGAHHLETGHEREFAICTLLVIGAVEDGFDTSTDLSQKFHDRAADYDALPVWLRDEILAAYEHAPMAPPSELASTYAPPDGE